MTHFDISKNYFIYFNTLFYNIPYVTFYIFLSIYLNIILLFILILILLLLLFFFFPNGKRREIKFA